MASKDMNGSGRGGGEEGSGQQEEKVDDRGKGHRQKKDNIQVKH